MPLPRPLPRRLVAALGLVVLLFAAAACGQTTATSDPVAIETTTTSGPTSTEPPVTEPESQVVDVASVYAEPTFEVAVTEDVVYGQALSHENWGSDSAETMDLLLDVYEPVRSDDAVMPAIVMIHGGGFNGGSKSTRWISEWAPWFAERGWVVYSIDYRVSGDHGTLPTDYPELPAELTGNQLNQALALYPACRDAKAAIRWVNATADEYSVSTDHIAVVGGSAGSVMAVTLGATDQEDCTDEISVDEDPTLVTTNLDQPSDVATVIDHWGGTSILTLLELMDGVDRFDPTDAPISIVHGTEDPTVLFSEAETIRAAYDETGVAYGWHPLEGFGHGPWQATIDGQPLFESAYDFIIDTQELTVS